MIVPAVAFWQVVLSVHIIAVVAGFGVVFAYPFFDAVGARIDPGAMPSLHRLRLLLVRALITPGLTVVLIAGIYLAAKLHQWHAFYIQWGLGVAIVIGGVAGAFFSPSEKKLAELAERDVAAAGGGAIAWSPEYKTLNKRVAMVATAVNVLILITIYLMTVQSGA
jgi:hypothetical protein